MHHEICINEHEASLHESYTWTELLTYGHYKHLKPHFWLSASLCAFCLHHWLYTIACCRWLSAVNHTIYCSKLGVEVKNTAGLPDGAFPQMTAGWFLLPCLHVENREPLDCSTQAITKSWEPQGDDASVFNGWSALHCIVVVVGAVRG